MRLDLKRPRDIGRILDDAFSVLRANAATLLICAAAVVLPVQLLIYGIGLGWLTGRYDSSPPLGEIAAGALAGWLVVTPLVTAMTVHVVQRAAQGARARPAETVRAGLDAFALLIGPIALVALGVGFGLLLIVPGLILLVRWAVVPQVVVVERVGGTRALGRSMELTAGRGWFTFLVVLVGYVLVSVLTQVLALPADAAAKAADAQVLVLAGQGLAQVLALPVMALIVTLLYFTLCAERGGAAPEPPVPEPPAPEPDDDPFARRREEGWEPPV